MRTQKKQGFTIIEVVLVLAIAGLIFLMVFIALPALQRGQRDTGRKTDVGVVASALNTYLSNNKGSFRSLTGDTASSTVQAYIDSLNQYEPTDVTVTTESRIDVTTEGIQIKTGAQCPATTPVPGVVTNILLSSGTARQAAIFTALENNGSKAQFYCQNI